MSRRARVLEPADVRRLLRDVRDGSNPERDTVIILLSFNAGLRACEIAGLSWPMVLAANGRVTDSLDIAGTIAKNGRARRIPLNGDLKAALQALKRIQSEQTDGPVVRSLRGGHMKPRSIVKWFARLYDDLGYHGCSSHSGRRTFVTRTARVLTRAGASLRDVQELVGHSSLSTTERYIEGDRDAQRKLVNLI
jgi:integrase/recombinase XerD